MTTPTENHNTNIDRHFVYNCAVCGKNTIIEKGDSETEDSETAGLRAFNWKYPTKIHHVGCSRISQPSYTRLMTLGW